MHVRCLTVVEVIGTYQFLDLKYFILAINNSVKEKHQQDEEYF